MTAFLLCAGLGTRFRPHTEFIAKPALPVLNIPTLCYSLFFLEHAGLNNLIVNTHHLPRTIEHAINTLELNYPCTFSSEQPKILGSGGALKNAKHLLPDHFLLGNGDAVVLFEDPKIFDQTAELNQRTKAIATLVVIPHPQAGKELSAVWVENDRVVGFGRSAPTVNAKPFHFIGFTVFSKDILKYLPEGESNIFYDGILGAIAQGHLANVHIVESAKWYEAGNEHDYLRAHQELLSLIETHKVLRQILDRFSHGWSKSSPYAGLYFNGDYTLKESPKYGLIGKNCLIHPDAQFSKTGFVVLGDECEIKKPVLLDNVVMGMGATTEQKGHLAQTFISRSDIKGH